MRKISLNKKQRIILVSLAAMIVLAFVIFSLAKGWLMDKAVAKMENKLKNKYGIILSFKDYRLEGWKHVKMEGISCLTPKKDTLVYFDKVAIDVKLLPMLLGKLRLQNIEASGGILDVGRLREIKSLSKKQEELPKDTSRFAKIKKYLGYLEDLAAMLPDDFKASDLRMSYRDSSDTINAFMDSIRYHNNNLLTTMRLRIKGQEHLWTTNGFFDRSSLKTDMTVRTSDTAFYNINFIKKLARADIGFRQFHFKLDELDDESNEIKLIGRVEGNRLLMYNERMADDTIKVNHGALDFNISLQPGRILLDQGTSVSMNGLSAGLAGEYVYRGHELLRMQMKMPPVDAQKMIDAFPEGTFQSVKGMKMKGRFSYKLNFYFDMFTKDSILIDSDLDGSDLEILQYGEAKLDKLRGSFTYYPYNSKRPILVGPENPKFTPLDNISNYLKSAVLTNEDPSFYYHHGFVEEALEQSFVKNVKSGEFSRGGSTISMQLVKNVFLTHKKTIERKMEEAFLVWLIENMHIVSKSRMMEVYLNVIEWGPNVYGVGEAAPFYFNTTPSNLTLNEGIFLASIIPQPLGFQWRFDKEGNLKEYMQHRLEMVTKIMERRRQITPEDTLAFYPNVFINGPARSYLKIEPKPEDTIENNLPDIDWKDILDLK